MTTTIQRLSQIRFDNDNVIIIETNDGARYFTAERDSSGEIILAESASVRNLSTYKQVVSTSDTSGKDPSCFVRNN